jgi:hypothetical protein
MLRPDFPKSLDNLSPAELKQALLELADVMQVIFVFKHFNGLLIT